MASHLELGSDASTFSDKSILQTTKEKKPRALYERTPEEKEALRNKIATTLAERRAKRAQLAPPPPPPPPPQEKPKSNTIKTAWTAWVDAKGSVAKAAASKKANPQEYLDYAANWKKENPK